MFICPSLRLKDIEDMTIQEITERIEYHRNLSKERNNAKYRDFFSILTNSIAVGNRYARSGKKEVIESWEKSLNNIFSNSDKKEKINIDKEVSKLKEIFG